MMTYGIYSHALLLHDAIVSQEHTKYTTTDSDSCNFDDVLFCLKSEDLVGSLRNLLSNVFLSTRGVVSALSQRLNGPMSDLLIDIIVEELRRIKEASWSSYYPKVRNWYFSRGPLELRTFVYVAFANIMSLLTLQFRVNREAWY